jgi:hypothetical protein
MPDVPQVPGVPDLLSYAGGVGGALVLLTQDVLSLFGIQIWGIFFEGIPLPALFFDNMLSFSYKQDFPISTYPVEQGGFQTYDKVRLPGEVRCRFSTGGSVAERQLFIFSIDAAMTTTQLYDIVTPEKVFLGYNFTHRDYDRTAESAGLVIVDIWLTEVVTTSSSLFQSTQVPGIAGQSGQGIVSPQQFSSGGGSIGSPQFPAVQTTPTNFGLGGGGTGTQITGGAAGSGQIIPPAPPPGSFSR